MALEGQGEKAVPNLTVIYAVQMRSILGKNGEDDAAGLEIVAENGDRFVIALSGEGMKGLIEDMQSFLDDHPHLADQKSRPRQ